MVRDDVARYLVSGNLVTYWPGSWTRRLVNGASLL